jgi:hypothetical protein
MQITVPGAGAGGTAAAAANDRRRSSVSWDQRVGYSENDDGVYQSTVKNTEWRLGVAISTGLQSRSGQKWKS